MSRRKLDIDHTRERLLSLGMPYAAEQLEHLLSDSVKHSTAPHAFLEQMLEVEYQAREARRMRTALRLSNRPPACAGARTSPPACSSSTSSASSR
jgi:hypothetical protein